MPYRRLCLRILILVISGLATIGATIASAAESPHWAIEGNTLKELKLTSETVTGKLKPATAAKISVPKLGLTLVCKSATISEGKLEREGKSALTLPFSECSYEKLTLCTVDNFTVKAKGRLVLHAGTVYAIFEPLIEKGSLAEILTLGEECALKTKVALTGSFAASIGSQTLIEQPITTITSESTLKLIGAPELKFGINPATLNGSLLVSLSGTNKGKDWGASLDAGTALCKAELERCSTATTFSTTTELKGSLPTGTEATIETGLGTVNCTESSIKGNALGKESEMLRGEVSSLTFGSCKSGAKACTVTAEKLPYTGELTYAGEGDGTINFAALGAASTIKIVCEGIINCSFGGASELDLEGGEPARITASKEALSVTAGALCPKEAAALTGAYELTAPSTPAFVAVVGLVPTRLCTEEPELNPMTARLKCPEVAYAGEIRGEGVAPTTFTETMNPARVITCGETKIAGRFQQTGEAMAGEGVTSFDFRTEEGPCTSTLVNNPLTAVTLLNFNYTSSAITYKQPEPDEGSIGISGRVGSPTILRVQFEESVCDYRRISLGGEINNALSLMSITGAWTNQPLVLGCPSGFIQGTVVTFGRPEPGEPDEPVYVAAE